MTLNRVEIERLYKKHGPMVHRRCRALLGDEEEAWDAMQEVFMRLLKNNAAFRGDASPTTWLYRVSTNLCLNRIRDKKTRARKLAEPDPSAATRPGMGTPASFDPERRRLVLSLLEHVDEETRRIVVYYFLDEMTLDEISELMNLSAPTLRKRIKHFRSVAGRLLGPRDSAGMTFVSVMLFIGFLSHGTRWGF